MAAHVVHSISEHDVPQHQHNVFKSHKHDYDQSQLVHFDDHLPLDFHYFSES